jgi:hypothetical protein
MAEMSRLKYVHGNVQRHRFSHIDHEITEHRARGPRTNDRDSGTVLQCLWRTLLALSCVLTKLVQVFGHCHCDSNS